MDDAHRAVLTSVHGDSRLVVSCFYEFRMLERCSGRIHFHRIRTQEPAHQVYIMDRHIYEDPAACRREPDRPLDQSLRIDPRRLHHIWDSDRALFHLLLRISIRRVKTAHESQEEHRLRVTLHGCFRKTALLDRHSQRLIGEYMLSRI